MLTGFFQRWGLIRVQAVRPQAPKERPPGRSFLIDAIKAASCLLIVLHHLAFYGPMSDVVAQAWPAVIAALYEYGRWVVQCFLVCAGFLTAASLARFDTLAPTQALHMAGQRYGRLAIPLLAALSVTVLVTEFIRPDFEHPSLSATPGWAQALAHVTLSQHLLGLEALSAGIWYVAIDFQLYATALFSLMLLKFWPTRLPVQTAHTLRWGLWLGLTCASLWGWNLHEELDNLGIYFWGAYGLGMLAWAARHHAPWGGGAGSGRRLAMGAGLLVLGGVAWWLEPRPRIALAWGVAALLWLAPAAWWADPHQPASRLRRGVQWLSGVSYSVFLIHFGVSLAVSAWVTAHWPDALCANSWGLLLALGASVVCGGWLYRWVERHPPSLARWSAGAGAFVLSVAMGRQF